MQRNMSMRNGETDVPLTQILEIIGHGVVLSHETSDKIYMSL